MILRLRAATHAEIVAYAVRGYPREVVGLLACVPDNEVIVVAHALVNEGVSVRRRTVRFGGARPDNGNGLCEIGPPWTEDSRISVENNCASTAATGGGACVALHDEERAE